MRARTDGKGSIVLEMSYPEFELMSTVLETVACGNGGHRGAEYVNAAFFNATKDVCHDAAEEMAKQEEKKAMESPK